jgi:hypothetical protein
MVKPIRLRSVLFLCFYFIGIQTSNAELSDLDYGFGRAFEARSKEILGFAETTQKYRSDLKSMTDLDVNIEMHKKYAQKLARCAVSRDLPALLTPLAETLPVSGAILYATVFDAQRNRSMNASWGERGRLYRERMSECGIGRAGVGQVVATVSDLLVTSLDFLYGFEVDDRAIDPNDDYYLSLQRTRQCVSLTTYLVWEELFQNPHSTCARSELLYEFALKEAARRAL